MNAGEIVIWSLLIMAAMLQLQTSVQTWEDILCFVPALGCRERHGRRGWILFYKSPKRLDDLLNLSGTDRGQSPLLPNVTVTTEHVG